MTDEQTLQPEQVHQFACDVLVALGAPEDDAALLADSMVWSALHGRITHSLIRLVAISERARAGGLSLTADWTPVRTSGATVVLDAGFTWGTLAGARGMHYAVANARLSGVGVTCVRNCDNTGALSWYTSLALEAQMIGLAISNTLPLMPVWGGAHKLIGNQPMSFAVPAGKRDPIVVDQMLASERLNVLRDAAEGGIELDPGVIVDAEGRPTTDARAYAAGGAVLAMGKHRGAALALVFEILTGLLAGGRLLDEITGATPDDKYGASLYLMAIEPTAFFGSYQEFADRVDGLIDRIHAAAAAPGVDRVRVPGDQRSALAERQRRDGIPFAAGDVAKLRELATELGVAWPRTTSGAGVG